MASSSVESTVPMETGGNDPVDTKGENSTEKQKQPTHEEKVKIKAQIDAKSGTAPIKLEFIDYSKVHSLYGVDTTSSSKAETKQPKDEAKQSKDEAEDTGEPPAKISTNKDRRGQNKKRPFNSKRPDASTRVCPKLLRNDKCLFGDKCIFNHDLAKLVNEKPPDLGPVCFNFATYGKCLRGIMCRYGSSHISADYQNIVDEEKWKSCKSVTTNIIPKDLQWQLRKKKVKYVKSDKYLAGMAKAAKEKKRQMQENQVASGESDKKDMKVTGSSSGNGATSEPSQSATEANTKAEETSVIKTDQTNSTRTADEPSDKIDPNPGLNVETSTSQLGEVSSSKDAGCHGENKVPSQESSIQRSGVVTDEDLIKLRGCEKKTVDFRDKLFLAPLTTVGNLPFRRICKEFKADITCGEMAVCTNLLQGQASEWALLKRHSSEDVFGVQLAGAFADTMTKCAEILNKHIDIDFVDINVGCPIDVIYQKGAGCGLMNRVGRFEEIVRGMNTVLDIPLTVKMRTGVYDKHLVAAKMIPRIFDWGASVVTLHGRTREQRYTRSANWDYIGQCVQAANPYPMLGNGDVLSFEDANLFKEKSGVAGLMIARGALIKPWIFTEIKEQRHWDISSGERLDMLKDYCNYGMEHWGSDTEGVEKTRRFLLEWLSFLHRYIPVGVLERVPQQINQRPPYYIGRNDLETLMISNNCNDWVKISEMLLGPVPDTFQFLPKHKANSYN